MKNSVLKAVLVPLAAISLLCHQSCNSCEAENTDREDTIYDNEGGTSTDTMHNDNEAERNATGNYNNSNNTSIDADNNDNVENSSSNAYDDEGNPVNGGGSMGSGMGTGTGSTGNNSKVTDPEDQYN